MAAAFRPMSPAEPQLTAAQEARGWAVLDALDAAKASGDECRILQASLDLLDWQLAVGLLTRERWREVMAHMLPAAVRVLRRSPAGRTMLSRLRKAATANLKSADYRERAAAALFLHVSKRPAVKRKPPKRPAGITREVVDRSVYMAERISGLCGILAWDPYKVPCRMQAQADMREAAWLARRIVRLLGGGHE